MMTGFKMMVAALFWAAMPCSAQKPEEPATSQRSKKAVAKVRPALESQLKTAGFQWGAPVFIRVFKDTRTLEVWLGKENVFKHFQDFDICYFSGKLGPKKAEGDLQVPEGFYGTGAGAMNPWSSYHLSFNVGYPNHFDRSHGYTGSLIMIHGNCVSIGCLAMTDPSIEKIYALVEAALLAGQKTVPVHIFPFLLTDRKLEVHKDHPAQAFWRELQPGYQYFEEHRLIPKVFVRDRRYQIEPSR